VQFANLSTVAIIIAASPPYKRKARKIIASEKLKINPERGSVKHKRGATKIAKQEMRKNCQSNKSELKFNVAQIKHKPPNREIKILYKCVIEVRGIIRICRYMINANNKS
jgi:hypothetical protein